MPFKPAVGEPMKAIAHNQQLDAPPGCLRGIEAVGIIDLAAELADDPLDDVGGARHPRMIEVGEEKIHLVLKGEDLPLKPTVSESLPSSPPDPKPEAQLLFGAHIEEPCGQSDEDFNPSTRALIEIAEVVMEVAFRVADAELQRETGKELPASAPQAWISVHDEPLEGIANVLGDTLKQGLPELCRLHRCKAGQRDILRGGIGAEKKGPSFSPDVDSLGVEQKIAAPGGFEFLGHLNEALAVLAQGIDPLKDTVRTHVEISSHSAVRGLSVKVEMSGTQDEAARCRSLLVGITKSLAATSAPPAPNLACPQPLGSADFEPVETKPLGEQGATMRAAFFSSLSPSMR